MKADKIKIGMVVEVTGFKGQLFVIEEEIVPGIYKASTTILDSEIKQPKLELKLNPDFKKYQPTEEDREEEINEMKDSIIGSEGDR